MQTTYYALSQLLPHHVVFAILNIIWVAPKKLLKWNHYMGFVTEQVLNKQNSSIKIIDTNEGWVHIYKMDHWRFVDDKTMTPMDVKARSKSSKTQKL